jgi:ABC-2 type transport system permease protein
VRAFPGAWAVARRDLRAAFGSPQAWLMLFAWLLLTGILLGVVLHDVAARQELGAASDRPLYHWPLLYGSMGLILLAPAVTMGAFAGERAAGTWPLLLTAPVTDAALVLGKFLAAFGQLAALVVASLTQPLVLAWVSHVDPAQLACGWAGLLLLAAFLAALGTWISAAVDQPLAAFVLTFAAGAVLLLVGSLAAAPALAPLSGFLGLMPRLEPFLAGELRAGGVAYLGGGAFAFLVLAHGVLTQRRNG